MNKESYEYMKKKCDVYERLSNSETNVQKLIDEINKYPDSVINVNFEDSEFDVQVINKFERGLFCKKLREFCNEISVEIKKQKEKL